MPFWAADSIEERERLVQLFHQLFKDPDPKKRRDAADLLLKDKGEFVRQKTLELWEQEGFFKGWGPPAVDEKWQQLLKLFQQDNGSR